MVAVILFKPESEVREQIDALETGAAARTWFASSLPQLLPYLDDEDLGRFAARPIGRLPSFQLVEGDLHASTSKGGVVLIGDAIKAVKPYFGQGCNSALEDVAVLATCLDDAADDPSKAAPLYTRARSPDTRALVSISRSFDGKGRLGTLRFVGPLVIDSALHRVLPRIFSPPLLRAIQDEKVTFSGVLRRKRIDRLVLFGTLAAAVVALRAAAGSSAAALLLSRASASRRTLGLLLLCALGARTARRAAAWTRRVTKRE